MLMISPLQCFFFNDTATTEIYTLSLHDALPISPLDYTYSDVSVPTLAAGTVLAARSEVESVSGEEEPVPEDKDLVPERSEEHTSELQSRQYLVCRPLLETIHSLPSSA